MFQKFSNRELYFALRPEFGPKYFDSVVVCSQSHRVIFHQTRSFFMHQRDRCKNSGVRLAQLLSSVNVLGKQEFWPSSFFLAAHFILHQTYCSTLSWRCYWPAPGGTNTPHFSILMAPSQAPLCPDNQLTCTPFLLSLSLPSLLVITQLQLSRQQLIRYLLSFNPCLRPGHCSYEAANDPSQHSAGSVPGCCWYWFYLASHCIKYDLKWMLTKQLKKCYAVVLMANNNYENNNVLLRLWSRRDTSEGQILSFPPEKNN